MSNFNHGENGFTIDFKLSCYQCNKKEEGGMFDLKMVNSNSYNSVSLFNTKNEAIDAMIKQLKDMKE